MFHLGLENYGDNGDDEKIMGDGEDNMMVMRDAKNKKRWVA
jgi:hypothetical protein